MPVKELIYLSFYQCFRAMNKFFQIDNEFFFYIIKSLLLASFR